MVYKFPSRKNITPFLQLLITKLRDVSKPAEKKTFDIVLKKYIYLGLRVNEILTENV